MVFDKHSCFAHFYPVLRVDDVATAKVLTGLIWVIARNAVEVLGIAIMRMIATPGTDRAATILRPFIYQQGTRPHRSVVITVARPP